MTFEPLAAEFAIVDVPPTAPHRVLAAWQSVTVEEERRWLAARLFHERRNDHPNAQLRARTAGEGGDGEPVDPFTVYDVRESGRSRPGGPGYAGVELYPGTTATGPVDVGGTRYFLPPRP